MSHTEVTLIRPLIYVGEKDVAGFAKDLPVVHNPCPANKHTQRESMKEMLKQLSREYPDLDEKFANAIMHPERYNLFPPREGK